MLPLRGTLRRRAAGTYALPSPGTPLSTDGVTLLGDLLLPGGAWRDVELEAVAACAAHYAARARGDGTRRVDRSA